MLVDLDDDGFDFMRVVMAIAMVVTVLAVWPVDMRRGRGRCSNVSE